MDVRKHEFTAKRIMLVANTLLIAKATLIMLARALEQQVNVYVITLSVGLPDGIVFQMWDLDHPDMPMPSYVLDELKCWAVERRVTEGE